MATSPHVLALIEKARQRHAESVAAAAERAAQKQASIVTTATHTNPTVVTNVATQIATATAPSACASAGTDTTIITKQATKQATGIDLNEDQQLAVELGLRGKSFVMIGAAGTGKTTTTQELIKLLQQSAHVRPLSDSTKHLTKGAPGFVIVGYTNKAVNNLRKKLPTHLQSHCLTIHKLIEFAPEYFVIHDDKGNEKNTMRFMPSRNGANPLPFISTIIFEESSMIGTDLYGQLLDALRNVSAVQMIFLGDIFQLPPVFGPSILGFKMSELPVVELKHVYRQALASPIISLATAVRTNALATWLRACASIETTGNTSYITSALDKSKLTITEKIVADNAEHGKVTIRPWRKRLAATAALKTISTVFTGMIDSGEYDPESDQILCPFNVSFGTIELNKHISDHLAKTRGATVHEVIARYARSYWAVGDRVLVDRHDAVITKIEPTIGYCGVPAKLATTTLNRWGHDPILDGDKKVTKTADEILNELDAIAEAEDDEGKNLASHTITVYISDLDEERKLDTAGTINNMLMSYVLTVHKSQGSEWRRVFIVLHSSHQTMVSRELMYTAMTRAREELYILCEGDVGGYTNQLQCAAKRAVVPGTTLAEKIEYFKGKANVMKGID